MNSGYTSPMPAVVSIEIPFPKLRSGKVREVYDLGDSLLMVATDRISAFDVVLPNGIPDKGRILNQLSAFWFESLAAVVPNHCIATNDDEIRERLGTAYDHESLSGRSMLVHKCQPFPIECVARAYLAGSLYKEYIAAGEGERDVTLHGISLPAGIQRCGRLPEPIFTPATKANEGHDENIDEQRAAQIVGDDCLQELKKYTLDLFARASRICETVGILLADTKLEFGSQDGRILLIDEAFTPDSSRYWPADKYRPGAEQESLDKQFVRNYLETLDWDKTAPGPILPDSVVQETRSRYIEIFRRITGREPLL